MNLLARLFDDNRTDFLPCSLLADAESSPLSTIGISAIAEGVALL
jgi:hypothetical protein